MNDMIATGFDCQPLPDGSVLIESFGDDGKTSNKQVVTPEVIKHMPLVAVLTEIALTKGPEIARQIMSILKDANQIGNGILTGQSGGPCPARSVSGHHDSKPEIGEFRYFVQNRDVHNPIRKHQRKGRTSLKTWPAGTRWCDQGGLLMPGNISDEATMKLILANCEEVHKGDFLGTILDTQVDCPDDYEAPRRLAAVLIHLVELGKVSLGDIAAAYALVANQTDFLTLTHKHWLSWEAQ